MQRILRNQFWARDRDCSHRPLALRRCVELPHEHALRAGKLAEQAAPGVSASILEGLDEMLTGFRLGLPQSLRRSLACTNG